MEAQAGFRVKHEPKLSWSGVEFGEIGVGEIRLGS